ncbi:GNAT family N-acetyltransferase [Microbulbifer sp. VAAF005]|uniref:GNAT family N-acetyltransferase n=1 Tax=Microbulbifer sp. VAAF005 TaxID=3034230 RepID=UPI0024ADB47E|nr:GNAT family N-acetyltransferase [Microbulbifer sp. VAAF005]WHI46983.1 GNAT family N-acetyltransferase [Microbulbifer sp. VAAF005]
MVKLRDLTKRDEPLLVEYLNNTLVLEYLSSRIPYPYTAEDAAWWVEVGSKEVGIVKAIECDGVLCGVISMYKQEFEHSHSGEIGYWIAKEYWGKGIATEALMRFSSDIFSSGKVVRLFASVFSGNDGSVRVLQKAGFDLEGVLNCSVRKGVSTLMSIFLPR